MDEGDELHERIALDGTWLDEGAVIEHEGCSYSVDRSDETAWTVTDESGGTVGSIILVSAKTESDKPVYGGRRPGQQETFMEEPDWRGIVKALADAN